jgi:integrase
MKRRFDALSGVEKWRLHDLRRTAGTNMAKLGIPVFVISRVLNHAEGGVTSIYARASYLKEKRHALETWATKLESLVSPTAQDKTVEQHA